VTIAFLGGSTTACNAVQEDARFPGLVGRLLTEPGISTNGLNAVRSGGTLHDTLNVLLNHVLPDEPDIVVVMHATNDIGVLHHQKSYDSRTGAAVRLADLAKRPRVKGRF
jgi:lysophospholipase L1-like esterase